MLYSAILLMFLQNLKCTQNKKEMVETDCLYVQALELYSA